MNCYIYKISNIKNDKLYFGLTVKNPPKIRWNEHKSLCKKGENFFLYKAMRKHGIENFKFEIIFTVFDVKNLNEFENYFIEQYKTLNPKFGYNTVANSNKAEFLQKEMKKVWADPKQREHRIAKRKISAQKSAKKLIAISIYSGEASYFNSTAEARKIASMRSIFDSLQKKCKGEGYIWFYNDESKDLSYYKEETLKIIGSFNILYCQKIIAENMKTGEKKFLNDLWEVKSLGIKPKVVARILRANEIRNRISTKGWKFYFQQVTH